MGAPPPTGPPLPPAFSGGVGGAWARSENPEIIRIAVSVRIFFIFIVFKLFILFVAWP